MSTELIAAILAMVVRYGPELTIEILNAFKTGKTIDDAIAALEKAKGKTAQQYLDEAKANIPTP